MHAGCTILTLKEILSWKGTFLNRKQTARKFHNYIKNKKKLIIQTHDYPDPDAIAAAFGLSRFLAHFGIKTMIVYGGEIERAIVFEMMDKFKIKLVRLSEAKYKNEDEVIVVDGQIGNTNITRLNAKYIAIIDHHVVISKPKKGILADIRTNYGSSSSIIGEYFRYLNVPVPESAATVLLIGLNTDTLRLIRGASVMDIEIYAFLYELSNQDFLKYVLINNIELSDLKLFSRAIKNLNYEKRFGFANLQKSDNIALLAITCDFLLQIREIDLMLSVAYTNEKILLSMRSEVGAYPANIMIKTIVSGLGTGGGHKTMAAASIRVEPDMKIKKVLNLLKDRFFSLQK